MKHYLEIISSQLSSQFSPDILSKLIAEASLKITIGLIVLLIFYGLWWIIQLIMNFTIRKKIDKTSFTFFRTIIKFLLISMAIVFALDSAGIKTSAILASLGVVGLTIGFAAKDALSNLISGILIFIDRPFVLGDLVEIEGTYGQVDRITLRSTRVVTPDGKMLAVPNTEIINKTVVSYTNFPHLRIDVKVTVSPNEDLDLIKSLLINIIKQDPDYLHDKPIKVVVLELNDYNICLQLQAWLDDEKLHVNKRFELRENIFKVLTKHGIEMPFETLQLRPIDLNIKNKG